MEEPTFKERLKHRDLVIENLCRLGLSQSLIANLLGVSVATVSARIKDLEIVFEDSRKSFMDILFTSLDLHLKEWLSTETVDKSIQEVIKKCIEEGWEQYMKTGTYGSEKE